MLRKLALALTISAIVANVGGCKKDEPAPETKAPTETTGKVEGAVEAPKIEEPKAPEAGTEAVKVDEKAPDTEAPKPIEPTEESPKAEQPTPAGDAAQEEASKAAAAQTERQKQLQDIYTLGRQNNDESISKLVDIMKSDQEPGIRATAIRVISGDKIDRILPTLKELANSDVQPVKIEAAILLYKWGEKEFASPILDELSGQGVALRRAFLIGRKDGKNQYDPAAKGFLQKGLGAENVYTRLDAALGLYEIGDEKKALEVFQNVMEKEETFYVRLAALNYLRHLKDDPKIKKVIEIALKDKDERVQKRAEQILNETAPNPE